MKKTEGKIVASAVQQFPIHERWGKGTVLALSNLFQRKHVAIRGISAQNICPMRHFFDANRDQPNLSSLLRVLQPRATEFFKDVYNLAFLGLPAENMPRPIWKGHWCATSGALSPKLSEITKGILP